MNNIVLYMLAQYIMLCEDFGSVVVVVLALCRAVLLYDGIRDIFHVALRRRSALWCRFSGILCTVLLAMRF